jgi:poly[(R)-3-hydroxyalkanoate] polymerase subunit PhaC
MSDTIDRSLRALSARATLGVAPSAMMGLWFDWTTHLAFSPGKRMLLGQKAWRKNVRLFQYAAMQALGKGPAEPCIEPLPQDHRFDHQGWQTPPFNLMYQSFLLGQQWWHNATTEIRGMDERDAFAASFVARQLLDMWAPSNFPWLNPEVIEKTRETGGANFQKGLQNFIEDVERAIGGNGPVGHEAFRPGETVAATPGKVVYRNRVMELIQYAPATRTVRPEPILITPAWIMKYYILDLSPHNSLVKYLTEQGFTVFMISWMNPTPDDRDLGLEDYRVQGPMAALDVIEDMTGAHRIHGVGYCLGGTLMSIVAAAMARDGDNRLASLSLFAAQQDFSEAGELMLFIEESEIAYLEDMMWEQGFLDAKQMAGAFQILRSTDLIWSRYMREYLLGERSELFDLMAWNSDTTRMPYRMHSEYLRKLYKNNELAFGQYPVNGAPVAMKDVTIPIFAVGAEHDHVAPWRSAYKIHLLADAEVTFSLTTGGHNSGVLSEPGHKGRSYQIATTEHDDVYVSPEAWRDLARRVEGSWWDAWVAWLDERSGERVKPPMMGSPKAGYQPICDAPGTYVMMT